MPANSDLAQQGSDFDRFRYDRRRAAYACDPHRSRGRLLTEPFSATRSDFQRDRDRIIHSTAFRRLKHKSQVFVYHEGDHFRTRLTHTIEVAQIARSLARALGLDEDLAEALALVVEAPPPASIYEIDDGREGGYGYGDMAAAAGEGLGRSVRSVPVPRVAMEVVGWANGLHHALGGAARILTRAKVSELFHPDWAVHDRRLAATIGFRPRYDLSAGFRDTILWYRQNKWL